MSDGQLSPRSGSDIAGPETRYGDAPWLEGSIDVSAGSLSGDVPSVFGGWVLLPAEAVAKVEVSIDGRRRGLARLGLERPDIAALSSRPEAPICGFEYWVSPEEVPRGAEQLTLGVRAVGTHGTAVSLREVTVPIARRSDDGLGAAASYDGLAHRRARVARMARRGSGRDSEVKLLAFTHELAYGGAPLYLVELLRQLTEQAGVSCAVVGLDDGPLRYVYESMGIPVHVTRLEHGLSPVAYEDALCELAAWAAPQGFDAVHVNAMDSYIAADLAARLEVPAVWAIHESFDPAEWWTLNTGAPPEGYVWERFRSSFAKAAALVFGTKTTRQLFLGYGNVERLVTMPYGISLEKIDRYRQRFDPERARARLGIDPSATVVLNVATIEPRKGQTVLAEAFSAWAEARPDAVLVLVGETDREWSKPYVSGLRDYVRRVGLESRVTIAPVTPDPYEWLGIADVFVLASDIESLPLIVLEGMAFELPMVATEVFGIPELVVEGRTGYLCRRRDVGDLTAAVGRALAAQPAERQVVAKAGADAVRRDHDAHRYGARMARLVRALRDDPRALPGPILSAA